MSAYQDTTGQVREINSAFIKISGLPLGSDKTHRLSTINPRSDVVGLEEAIEAVTKVVDGETTKPVLLYSPEKGVGKTHIAIGAAWMMLGKGKTVAFYPVSDLLDELKEGYRNSDNYRPDQLGAARTYEQTMGWIKTVHLLVLDDIGLQKMSEWASEKLDQIVDYRYSNNKALILTANSLKFSDRIVDRCKEGALIKLSGPSYRGMK